MFLGTKHSVYKSSLTARLGELFLSSLGVRDSGALLCVHVLRDRGIGDGLGGRLKAALAAQAAAVAAETVQLPPRGVMGRDAPSLGVERVIVVNVIIVSVPRTRCRSRPAIRGEAQGHGVLLCSQSLFLGYS